MCGGEMSPEDYLELWLSEQIPIKDWLKLLDEDPKIEEIYNMHIANTKYIYCKYINIVYMLRLYIANI